MPLLQPPYIFFGIGDAHSFIFLQALPTLICSQCGRVENFFESKMLGIKKYFLAYSSAAKM
jgi:hypothetical protein